MADRPRTRSPRPWPRRRSSAAVPVIPAHDRPVVAIVIVAGKCLDHSTDGAGRRVASVPIRAAASGIRGGECKLSTGEARAATMRPPAEGVDRDDGVRVGDPLGPQE